MTHDSYYKIAAPTHFELGLKKGELFGDSLRRSLKKHARGGGWKRRAARAEPYLDATRERFPRLVEELEGYATGADVALADLWAWDLDDELDRGGREKCTTFVTNQGLLLGHNEDWEADAADDICVLHRTVAGESTFELYYLHTLGGSAMGVNSHGVVHAVNSVTHADHAVGVPKGVVARWIADSDSPQRVITELPTIKRSSGFHHTLATPLGFVWSIECTARQHRAEMIKTPFVHTNHYLCDAFTALDLNDDQGGTLERYKQACLHVNPHMTISASQALLSDASQGKKKSLFNRRTIARAVVDIDHMTVYIWLAREAKRGWVEYAQLFDA